MNKGLERGNQPPSEQLTGQPDARSNSLHNDIRWDLGENDASGEQLGSDIDLIRCDIEVFCDSRCQNGAYISAIHLQGEESSCKNGNDDEVDSERHLLVICS